MSEQKSLVLRADNIQQSIVEKERRTSLLAIYFDHISKKFGQVVANDSIPCGIHAGGIHAFLGENGAGKSTLMKILAGYYQSDAGAMYIDRQLVSFKSPIEAKRFGIGMVHQQFTLVPSLTVIENIMLGHPATPMILQPKKQAEAVAQRAAQYGIELDLYAPVSRLNMAQKQKVEILKLLWRDTRILILDEPTSQLAPFEADEILQTMTTLSQAGKIVILITHHIQELLNFASVISVLRQGQLIASFDGKSVQSEELAQIMIGEKTENKLVSSDLNNKREGNNLFLKEVSVKASANNRALNKINLKIKVGEVHGIAAVASSGQDELAALLAGHLAPEAGELHIEDKRCDWKDLRHPHKSMSYIPADPKRASLAGLTLLENFLLRGIHRKEYVRGPFIKKDKAAQMAKERIDAFDVRPKHVFALGGSLSGGNLQRLIIAREFDKRAPLMVAVNPTAGLDLAMSLKIRQHFREHAAKGNSVLLVSPDLDELLKTCDRISVMFSGRIVGTENVSNLNSEKLGLLMGGKSLTANEDSLGVLNSYNNEQVSIGQGCIK